MTNKDITKIYFQGNEIVALYQGDTLIFKKSGGGSTTEPTGVYTVRGTLKPDSTVQSIQLCVNGINEQIDINEDKTFEHTFVNVPVTNMDYFTLQCKDDLKTIDLSNFDTSQVTIMVRSFYGCSNLTSIDLTNVNTSNVTDMSFMFSSCRNLTSLDLTNFDTSNVTDMSFMFSSCRNLTSLDLTNFDTSNVTDMQYMFSSCSGLTSLDLTNFDTSNVTDMNSMFSSCSGLTSLDLTNVDTSNVTDMNFMFSSCSGLTSLDVSNFNTSNVKSMNSMFSSCSGLTSLDLTNFDTSNVMNMQYMFGWCDTLVNLYINFDTSNVTNYNYFNSIFIGDNKLENVVGKFEGTKYDLNLASCPLTAASAMVFINGLATVTEQRTLSLSATTYDSLTPEQIAIATSKGWTVTRS